MNNKLFEYLENFMIQNNWLDEYTQKQARAIFTTICLIENIDADTKKCNDILSTLYWRAALEELIEYNDFESYMVGLIV